MRVVSLVPSWTETLIEAGVNVVGRTRFCIHPATRIKDIAVVGGTKGWDFAAIRALKPDLILLDREENPKWMAEQSQNESFATHVTHVTGVDAMPGALTKMAERFREAVQANLTEAAARWDSVARWEGLPPWQPSEALPGLIEWGRAPTAPVRKVIYVIWRNPWMAVSNDTFIGSVLTKIGFGPYMCAFESKYPTVHLTDFAADETLLLFSSEPYPFLRQKSALEAITGPYAFVDGEQFSWFGMRSLRFIEGLKHRGLPSSR